MDFWRNANKSGKKRGKDMACNSINSTIEIFSIVLLLVMLLATAMKKREKNKMDRLYMLLLFLHSVNTLGDLAAWRFTYKPGTLALILTTVGNFSTYFFGAMTCLVFFSYVYLDATGGKRPTRWSIPTAAAIVAGTLFNMGLTLYNFKSGVLYTINDSNEFTWGRLSSLPDNIVLMQTVLTAVLILCNVKRTKWRKLMVSMLYLLVPFVATLMENWQTFLMLLYPALAISSLLIYVVNQQKQETQLTQRELELSESRINVMVSQIQPHFLYNSLNSIYHLCEMDGEKAQQAISDFSDYLRGNLDSLKVSRPVPFETELKHLQNYLALEQIRFEDELKVVYDIQESDFLLPALSVQPLVENAVKHGVGKAQKGGTITITTRRVGDVYEVIVKDNGVGFDLLELKQDGRSHVGIENVRQRVQSMCNGELIIESEIGKGTRAVIRIPR